MRGHLPFAAVTFTSPEQVRSLRISCCAPNKAFQVTHSIDSSKTELIGQTTELEGKQGFPTSHLSLRNHVAIDYHKYTE